MGKYWTALILSCLVFSGCIGEGSEEFDDSARWDKDMVQFPLDGLDDVRNFSVGLGLEDHSIGESNWAVFGNEEGGNCCEHYLAVTKEGWILNFGGNIQHGRKIGEGLGRSMSLPCFLNLAVSSQSPQFLARKGSEREHRPGYEW